LSSAVLGLDVAEQGPDARVVTVVGEVDALTAPELGAFLTAQLVVAQVVVVNLDGVRFMGSAGLSVLFAANEVATREDRDLRRLVCNSQTANLALEITGLREQFIFADNVSDALTNSPWRAQRSTVEFPAVAISPGWTAGGLARAGRGNSSAAVPRWSCTARSYGPQQVRVPASLRAPLKLPRGAGGGADRDLATHVIQMAGVVVAEPG